MVMAKRRRGWFGESGRHSLAKRGLTKVLRLAHIRKVIDPTLDRNIDTMKTAAHRAGRHDLDGVYEQLRENQSRPQLVYEEKVVKAPGIIAKLRRQREKRQEEKRREERLVTTAKAVVMRFKKKKPPLPKKEHQSDSSSESSDT